MTVDDYFVLDPPENERLRASGDGGTPYQTEQVSCPVTAGHARKRRVGTLAMQVKHNSRDERLIWLWGWGCVIHTGLATELEARGLTGFRLRPATVRFRDGILSHDYSELVTIGWAGIARPESGIRLLEECPGCLYRKYSALQDADLMIDWQQWSGDDLFIVWPLPAITFITKRVADALKELRVRSYSLESPRKLEQRNALVPAGAGFSVGRLSWMMPEDMAIKYGQALGLG